MSALVRYDAACRALAEAKSIDEAKDWGDKAAAMQAYARQAKNRQLEVDAAEIRMRAERRLGELMAAQRETIGLAKGARGRGSNQHQVRVEDGPTPPTLSEAGIDKHLADRARKMAAVPADQFESAIGEWRERVADETQRVTSKLLLAGEKEQARQERAAIAANGCTVDSLHAAIAAGQKFGCIYADPPWRYDNQGTRAATRNHYAEQKDENPADGMTVEQICALPVRELAADDAHLHMWTTNAFLFDAPRIFEAWGFEFRSSFVWVKPQIGIGNYWRNSHEFLLTAIRGDAKRFNDRGLQSWLQCDRGAHSAKPEQVRAMIERASHGPYLELFGRRVAEGWAVWGNQIESSLFSAALERAA